MSKPGSPRTQPAPTKPAASSRRNGKAPKQHPATNRKTGRTAGGYTPARIKARALRRLLIAQGKLEHS